ncbi:MAG: MCE-family protein Mce1B / MCE-family protein Mce1C [Acidimicrobiales bacterium]|nr:MCE-family protein Mce1B / MCE-family protein Mce1C [Acidimicrobiales bacterium]
MKSFTERNPVVIGIIVVAFIASATVGALMLNGGMFKDRYTVKAIFTDSAGLKKGDKIRVAGVPAGLVSGLHQAGDKVEVDLNVDKSIELSADTRAAIVVETLLGNKYVRLSTGHDWSRTLSSGAVIRDTETPTEFLDLQNTGTPLLEKSDGKALNDLLTKVDRIASGKRQDVGQIITGLNRLAVTINARQREARHLIDSARTVSRTLANRDQDLLATMDNLNVVMDGLARRRVQLAQLLKGTADTARKVADLVHANRPQLDLVLDELHQDLQIIGRHQTDLAATVSELATAVEGFASVGYSGPDDYPNRWANIYNQLIGPLSPDAMFGSCGFLDSVLDLSLGPDPVKSCAARTGNIPSSAQAAGTGAQPATGGFGRDPGPRLSAIFGPAMGAGA